MNINNKLYRRGILCLLCIICLSSLTSCARGDMHLTVNRDQSIDMTAAFSLNDQSLILLNKPDLLEGLEKRFTDSNIHVQPKNEHGRQGYEMSGHFAGDWSSGQGLRHLPEGIKVTHQVTPHMFTTNYYFMMTVDLSKMLPVEASGLTDTLERMNPLARKLLERQLDLDFRLSLPIRPGENNADSLSEDGKTMTWHIAPLQTNKLQLTVNVPNIRHIIYAGIALLVIIVLIIIVLLRRSRLKKHRSEPK